MGDPFVLPDTHTFPIPNLPQHFLFEPFPAFQDTSPCQGGTGTTGCMEEICVGEVAMFEDSDPESLWIVPESPALFC